MEEIIQIKCPFDGAVLSVKNQPGIETKSVTCPICKHKYPFTQFKRVSPYGGEEDPPTQLPNREGHGRYVNEETSTEIPQMNFTLGKLIEQSTGQSFQLRSGRNVVGRKGQKSTADFQIDTADKRAMSREHIVVEIKKVPGKGLVHFISLFKERVNQTFVGNDELLFGDCIVLNHGDIIRLPDATLRFEISDGEETDI